MGGWVAAGVDTVAAVHLASREAWRRGGAGRLGVYNGWELSRIRAVLLGKEERVETELFGRRHCTVLWLLVLGLELEQTHCVLVELLLLLLVLSNTNAQ